MKDIQRWLLFLFFFSLNFEVYNPFGTGALSVAKIAGFCYSFSLLFGIKGVLKSLTLKYFKPLYIFFIFLILMNFLNINYISASVFPTTIFFNIILLVLMTGHELRDPGILEKAFLWLAIGSILVAVLFYLGIGVTYDQGRVSIFGDNKNQVGSRTSISLIVIFLAVFGSTSSFSKRRFLLLIPVPLLFQMMVSTGSRLAFLSFAVSFVIGLFIVGKGGVFSRFVKILIGCFIGVIGWNFIAQNEMLFSRLQASATEGSLGGREEIWPKVITLISENPILGVGQTGYRMFSVETFVEYTAVHNGFLEILAYTGIIGLTVFLFFLIRLIFLSFRYFIISGNVMSLILFIPIFGILFSSHILTSKLSFAIFALACSKHAFIYKRNSVPTL